MAGNHQMQWLGRHEGLLRDISRGVGYGDLPSIQIAAHTLVGWIRCGSILVPMPSHIGYATTMLTLCKAIRRLNGTLKVCDRLRCVPHQSHHIQKMHGLYPADFISYLEGEGCRLSGGSQDIYIIDNCIGTGTSARSALKAMQYETSKVTVFAITKG